MDFSELVNHSGKIGQEGHRAGSRGAWLETLESW